VKKKVLVSCSVVLIANGIHSLVFPPEHRVKYWLDVAGIPVALGILYYSHKL
jgi:hypothetical protein